MPERGRWLKNTIEIVPWESAQSNVRQREKTAVSFFTVAKIFSCPLFNLLKPK